MMYIQVAGDIHSRAWIPQFMKNRGLLGRGRPRNWKQPMKSINQTLYTRTCAWWRHFIISNRMHFTLRKVKLSRARVILHKRSQLFTCQISLFTCMVSLFTCQISLFTCMVSLFTCQISLLTCQISLFTCMISLFSTKNCYTWAWVGWVHVRGTLLFLRQLKKRWLNYLHGVLVSFLVGLSNTE